MDKIAVNLADVEAGRETTVRIMDMACKVIMLSRKIAEPGSALLGMNMDRLEKKATIS